MSLSVAFFGKKDLVYIYLRAWFDYGGTFFPVLFLGGNRRKGSGGGGGVTAFRIPYLLPGLVETV